MNRNTIQIMFASSSQIQFAFFAILRQWQYNTEFNAAAKLLVDRSFGL